MNKCTNFFVELANVFAYCFNTWATGNKISCSISSSESRLQRAWPPVIFSSPITTATSFYRFLAPFRPLLHVYEFSVDGNSCLLANYIQNHEFSFCNINMLETMISEYLSSYESCCNIHSSTVFEWKIKCPWSSCSSNLIDQLFDFVHLIILLDLICTTNLFCMWIII